MAASQPKIHIGMTFLVQGELVHYVICRRNPPDDIRLTTDAANVTCGQCQNRLITLALSKMETTHPLLWRRLSEIWVS